MFNFETTWRKNRRLEGEILFYQNKAKRDAFKILELENIIKNLEIELTQVKAKLYELDPNDKWFTDQNVNLKQAKQAKLKVIKLKTTKSQTTKGKTK